MCVGWCVPFEHTSPDYVVEHIASPCGVAQWMLHIFSPSSFNPETHREHVLLLPLPAVSESVCTSTLARATLLAHAKQYFHNNHGE